MLKTLVTQILISGKRVYREFKIGDFKRTEEEKEANKHNFKNILTSLMNNPKKLHKFRGEGNESSSNDSSTDDLPEEHNLAELLSTSSSLSRESSRNGLGDKSSLDKQQKMARIAEEEYWLKQEFKYLDYDPKIFEDNLFSEIENDLPINDSKKSKQESLQYQKSMSADLRNFVCQSEGSNFLNKILIDNSIKKL